MPNTCVASPYTAEQNAEIADIIRDLRSKRGLTQAELCTQAGLSLYTVHRLERGDHVRPATMKLIIEALGRFDRVPQATVDRIASIYRFNASVVDPSAISQGDGFDAIGPGAAKDLHLLLDRALNAAGDMPSLARSAVLASIQAMLATIAGDTRPSAAATSTRLAKHHPPQRVGDHEVTVVEPVDVPEPDANPGTPAKRKNHG